MIVRHSSALALAAACSLALVLLDVSTAFSLLTAQQQQLRSAPQRRWMALKLSDSASGGGDSDDEVSKLKGKRDQIKRHKRKEGDSIEDRLLSGVEPTVDLDLDKLPEFKTERPVRRAKKADDGDDEGTENSSSKEPDAPIVDYLADYEDENDWHVPNRIGVTSVAWGDPSRDFVPAGKLTKRMLKVGKFVAGDVQLAVTKLLEGGITVIETSPNYGAVSKKDRLSAEDILKQCLAEADTGLPEVAIVENFASPWKALLRPGRSMVSALEDSLSTLGGGGAGDVSSVEVFLAPRRFGMPPTRLLAAGLAAQIESGQASYVGVSGITSPGPLRRLCRHLDARDCKLTAAAFDFSLTKPNGEAMISACKEAGVVPLITNPLDGGLASGVYTATNPSGGLASASRAKFSFQQLEKLQPLHSVQDTIAERVRTRVSRNIRDTQARFKAKYGPPPKINTDITTTQVALHWIIAKGGVPLVEVNSPAQADEVLGCLGWTLTDDEVSMIDAAVALCKL